MTDIPIIFSAPMVRALLDGRKTMTRRLAWRMDCGNRVQWAPSPWQKVAVGDRLWVRENFRLRADQDEKPPSQDWWKAGAWYFADDPKLEPSGCGGGAGKLRPCIHMPRWASRLTLGVTSTKIEPLQTMNGLEALAEGVTREEGVAPWRLFRRLWISLHGQESWDANPEVVALTFTVHQANVDKLKAAA